MKQVRHGELQKVEVLVGQSTEANVLDANWEEFGILLLNYALLDVQGALDLLYAMFFHEWKTRSPKQLCQYLIFLTVVKLPRHVCKLMLFA